MNSNLSQIGDPSSISMILVFLCEILDPIQSWIGMDIIRPIMRVTYAEYQQFPLGQK